MPAKKYEEYRTFPEFKENREKTSFLNALRNLDFPIFLHKCKINKKKNIHRLLHIARSNTRAKFQGKIVKAILVLELLKVHGFWKITCFCQKSLTVFFSAEPV